MGLNITALHKIAKVDGDSEWALYQPDGVPDRSDGIAAGNYQCGGDHLRFRAGSYSGYNEWRKWLAKTFLDATPDEIWDNPERFAGKPFIELINYSDCEGFIGPKTSAKLAADFAAHEPPVTAGPDFYGETYRLWRRAFEFAAADEGVVVLS